MVAGRQVTVEVRCYNHRFKDVRVKLPRGWMSMEVPAEGMIRSWLGRGRAECSVRSVTGTTNVGAPVLDLDCAREYLRVYRQLSEEVGKETGAEEAPGLGLIACAEGVVVFGEALDDTDAAWSDLGPLLSEALEGASRMREAEGAELGREITSRLSVMEKIRDDVRANVPEENRLLAERMAERVRTLADGVEVSEDRLAQEMAVMAERMDVTEELTRFDSHLVQFRAIMKRGEPIGRELDFLLQEMNREVNTLSSKMHSASIVNRAVSLKAEIEKIREQVQNVE
jgi:uncharacterized protein (TIGR00255 family)